MSKTEVIGSISYNVKRMPIEEVNQVISVLPLKTEPKEHQSKSIYLGLGYPNWMFALDMGLGKTKIALDLITAEKALNGKVRALVTCPPIVIRQWEREIKKHSDLTFQLIDQPKSSEKLDAFRFSNADVTVVSKNWITTLFAKARMEHNFHVFLYHNTKKFDMLIIDEAHTLKNRTTKGFKGFKDYLLRIPKRYLLTGTPIGNNFTEVWAPYYLIDKGQTFGKSYKKFIENFFFLIDSGGVERFILRKKKADEFFSLFWSKVSRYEENECNDLPEKTYTVIPVGMTSSQNSKYDAVLATIEEEECDTEEKRKRLSAQMFNLMRITAGIEESMSPKIEALKEVVRQVCLEQGKQIIIWCWLRDESDKVKESLSKEFKKLSVACVNGATSLKDKDKFLDQWKNGSLKVLIANQKSLGVGVDLYETNYCCYFSNNLSFIDRQQSEKRIHRTGQKNHCYYIDLVCENSIDEVSLKLLSRKKKGFKELTDDKNSLASNISSNEALSMIKNIRNTK